MDARVLRACVKPRSERTRNREKKSVSERERERESARQACVRVCECFLSERSCYFSKFYMFDAHVRLFAKRNPRSSTIEERYEAHGRVVRRNKRAAFLLSAIDFEFQRAEKIDPSTRCRANCQTLFRDFFFNDSTRLLPRSFLPTNPAVRRSRATPTSKRERCSYRTFSSHRRNRKRGKTERENVREQDGQDGQEE